MAQDGHNGYRLAAAPARAGAEAVAAAAGGTCTTRKEVSELGDDWRGQASWRQCPSGAGRLWAAGTRATRAPSRALPS